jgi:Na+-transporting NADH:ubiquinone oxidoreductase subunit NqrF
MKRLVLIITMIVFIAAFMINVTSARYVKTEKITIGIEMTSSAQPAAGSDSKVLSGGAASSSQASAALTPVQSESAA